MNTPQPHRLRTASASALLGLTALILVAAVLGGALAAVRANNTIDSLAHDLHDARGQIDALRDDNTRLAAQNQRILDQNRRMVRYLRRHGLEVPSVVAPTPPTLETRPPTSSGGVTTGPKARPSRSPSTPAGPGHTATPTPTPSPAPGGVLDPLCDLVPTLCPLT